MSGPLGSDQWMYSTGFYPYEINQSLRFNDDDSAYLSRTPATISNQKTWTWSGWVKLANLDISRNIINVNSGIANVPRSVFAIGSNNLLTVGINPSGTTWYFLDTTQVFRDCSGWYHLVLQVDTTQAVNANRTKVYVNGQEASLTGSYVFQNADTAINSTEEHRIGRNKSGANPADYYMAEVNFIDGQALDATAFGEFKSGVWIPKSYSGTYGTNGFRLDFGNASSLGADVSGNSNNWTPTNLASTDQMLDSPTNSFCTWNPLENTNIEGYSEGNTKAIYVAGSGWATARATVGISSGKRYWEISNSTATFVITGLANASMTVDGATYPGDDVHSVGYFSGNGNKYYANVSTSYGAAYGVGDVIGVAFDADAGSITFYKNGVSQGVAYTGLASGPYFPVIGLYQGTAVANFGQDSSFAGNKTRQGYTDARGIGDFYYAPPAGYLALCTANLPDPVIDPAQDDVPEDYFNTSLWAGNSSTQTISGMGFQPDFAWIKGRNVAYDHALLDAVRGGDLYLRSSTTAAEINYGTGLGAAFNSDGYDLGNAAAINQSGYNYVGWNWLAGNGTSTNTDGSITSTVSANQKAGFSIVTWTGNGNSSGNVGTGLSSSIPIDMAIVKKRSTASEWQVGHRASGQGVNFAYHLELNSTSALSGQAPYMMGSQATSNAGLLFLASEGLTNGVDYIAYCFTSVDGYSKFGSYTGNGSADGPFVYTGFRPAFVMIKSTSHSSTRWLVFDAARNTYNVVGGLLLADGSETESTNTWLDFTANGFKERIVSPSFNYPNYTYIYMAFAEMPFKYANAR